MLTPSESGLSNRHFMTLRALQDAGRVVVQQTHAMLAWRPLNTPLYCWGHGQPAVRLHIKAMPYLHQYRHHGGLQILSHRECCLTDRGLSVHCNLLCRLALQAISRHVAATFMHNGALMALFMNSGLPDWPTKTQKLLNLPLVPLQEPGLEDLVPSAQLLSHPLRLLMRMLNLALEDGAKGQGR